MSSLNYKAFNKAFKSVVFMSDISVVLMLP